MNPFLLLAALLPAIILLIRVYQLDHIEKEPWPLLGKLALGGVGAGLAACALEMGLMYGLERIPGLGVGWLLVIENFIVIALVEEVCKRAPVMLLAWKHRAFNYRFDAVVYCVFAAIGFAALENVLYVVSFGFAAAVSRALLSVPGHFFFAVYMGIYLGEAKEAEREGELFEKDRWLLSSLLVPVLLHGFWDFCLSVNNWVMSLAFFVFVMVFFFGSIQKLRVAAETDGRIK